MAHYAQVVCNTARKMYLIFRLIYLLSVCFLFHEIYTLFDKKPTTLKAAFLKAP